MTSVPQRTGDAGSELPLSAGDLARLASQVYAELSGVVAGGVPASAPAAAAPVPAAPTSAAPVAPEVPGGPWGGPSVGTVPAPSIPSPLEVTAPVAPFDAPGLAPEIPVGTPASAPTGVPRGVPGGSTPGVPTPSWAELGGLPDPTAWLPASPSGVVPWLATPPAADGIDDSLGGVERSGALAFSIDEPARVAPFSGFGQPLPRLAGGREVFDVDAIRRDFPILAERVNGHQLAWLDNAATTQKPQVVIDRLARFYATENSNIHRAAHELAARSTDAYEGAREAAREFLGAPRVENVLFVRGTTEAINLVAQSWGRAHLGPGDEIVLTHLEHHANIVPWQLIAQRTGAVIKVAPVDDRGTLILSGLEELVGPRTKIVSATHVSNALGTVNPVEKIVEIGHRYGARVLIDAAQSSPHLRLDVASLGADFVAFSGHKVYGPTGIGVLYGSDSALADTPPWQGGGNMIADVTFERSIFQGPPNEFEAGTGNIADAVGLASALRYVEEIGLERIAAYEHELLEYATERLAAVPGVRLVGTSPNKASVLSFVLDGVDPIVVGKRLNELGIAVRAGHHCAQPILRRLGLETTVRPSFAFYNTHEEADRLADGVRWIAENPNG